MDSHSNKNDSPEVAASNEANLSQSNLSNHSDSWTVKLEKFPEQLRRKRVWCIWRYEVRDDKPTKVPCQPTGYFAKSNDPATWVSFEEACAAADSDPEYGVGIFCDR